MPLTTLRQRLSGINRGLQKSPGTVVRVTYRGKPSPVVMSADLYDSFVEVLDLMSDPEAVEAFRGGLADIEAGRSRSLDEVVCRFQLRQ